MVRPTVLSLLACGAALVCAAPAMADTAPRLRGHVQKASAAGPLLKHGSASAAASRRWATVNICDTEKSADAMGLRASMPGNGTRQRMFMRFSAQWYSGSANQWLDVPKGVSKWIYAGSARYMSRQAGYTFDFVTPPAGRGYLLRAVAEFQWRSRNRPKAARRLKRDSYQAHPARGRPTWKIAHASSLLTRTGVKGVDGGDPPGTSKAICLISNPTP
jgi:hypothetical protein